MTTEALHLNRRLEVPYEGRLVDLRIRDIKDGKGITTKLDNDIWIDWHDVLDVSESAQLHMFLTGETKPVSNIEKLLRMQKIAGSIAVYDSLMVDDPVSSYSPAEITELLDSGRLPRAREAIINTGTLGLRLLFNKFGFPVEPEPTGAFHADWTRLAEIAESGALVGAWLNQKACPYDPQLVREVLGQFLGPDNPLLESAVDTYIQRDV